MPDGNIWILAPQRRIGQEYGRRMLGDPRAWLVLTSAEHVRGLGFKDGDEVHELEGCSRELIARVELEMLMSGANVRWTMTGELPDLHDPTVLEAWLSA